MSRHDTLRSLRAPRRGLAVALAAALLWPVGAAAQLGTEVERGGWRHALDVTVDAALLRPAACVVLFAGSVLFVPAAIMSAPDGRERTEEAWELFVLLPGRAVWGKPLGEL